MATSLAAAGHILAGGALPDPGTTAVLAALLLAPVAWLERRQLSFLTLSGVLAAAARMRSIEDLFSPYGVIVLAKTAALIILGVFGALHRRWSLIRLERDPQRGGRQFLALAVAELAVMGAASGMAAALARTTPPATAGAPPPAAVLLPEPGVWAYISQWAPDPLWSVVCGFSVFFYLAGVRRRRTAGQLWPAHRTVLWLAGVVVLFTVTNGGLHLYQGRLFEAHVLTQMMLTAVVPCCSSRQRH